MEADDIQYEDTELFAFKMLHVDAPDPSAAPVTTALSHPSNTMMVVSSHYGYAITATEKGARPCRSSSLAAPPSCAPLPRLLSRRI